MQKGIHIFTFTILVSLGLLNALSGCNPNIRAFVKQPNIVFILVDDLGSHQLGCYCSIFYETPNIDKLAREGMKFTSAYAASTVCSPTRASIMTGKWHLNKDKNYESGRPGDPGSQGFDDVLCTHKARSRSSRSVCK